MQNQHQTFHHLLFLGCYVLQRPMFVYNLIRRENESSYINLFRPHNKTQNTALRKIDRRRKGNSNSFFGMAQSPGLTDEFMCALINWFTQRLLHVDITLVQGLIVDFYYDKLLMEEWIATAADSLLLILPSLSFSYS